MIVRLWGGLGNQLFLGAFGRSVSLARNEEVFFHKYDLDGNSVRSYGLGAFNLEAKFAEPNGRPEWRERMFCFDEAVYSAPRDSYFVGHFQTEKYFREEVIRREFTLREPLSPESQRIADKIRSGPSCAIHVRRGDYLHPAAQAFHGCMTREWYIAAMAKVIDRYRPAMLQFFIFSDDSEWCKKEFPTTFVTVVDHNGKGREHEDLALMAMCDHAIIPNSTFGWWGCWLGDQKPNRIVIAPAKWFVSPQHDTRDIVPERWVKL